MNTKKDASVLSLFISKKTKHLISLYSFSGRTLPLAPAFQNSIPEPDHSPFHTAFWPVPLFQKSAGGGLSYKVKNCREIFSYFATVSYFFLSDLRYRAFLLEQSREQGSRNSQPEVWEDN